MTTTVHENPGVFARANRWLTTTSHKDIGTLYLTMSAVLLFVAGSMALVIRSELFMPGLQLTDPHFYNQMVSLHGFIMIFGVIMPAFTGLANWMIPLMIGAPDMALPRINNFAFWLQPFAFALLLFALFLPGGAPAAGWTMYAPLVLQTGASLPFLVFAVHLLGIASVVGAINIIATIMNLRAPGMTLLRMPMFVWTWLITSFLIIVALPVLSGTVTMVLTDAYFGTTFFGASGGGDPVLYQHLFWFFGHPEVYIMILPAFGVISEVIPTFSRKPLFGYSSMVYATAAIAFLSMIVWAHHMFTAGLPLPAELFFMFSTMLISVPTGVKIFNWTATMWRGSLSFETPMLFAIGFVVLFTIGGLSGVMLAIVPADIQYHDSYFVVAHLHYVVVSGALFGIFAGVYYWLPKWTGTTYSERLGQWHFWLSVIFMNITFFPQHFLGLAGMPRRIPDYSLQFVEFNAISSVGAFGFGIAQLLLVWAIVRCIREPNDAPAQPWEAAAGLEWTVASPAPAHTFDLPPSEEELAASR
jgi:cytochrome c oxidase subunit 1